MSGSSRSAVNAQAHLVRPAKVLVSGPGGDPELRTRNWSLFLFFRILSVAEMKRTMERIEKAAAPAGGERPGQGGGNPDGEASALNVLELDLAHPTLAGAGVVSQALAEKMLPPADGAAPAGSGGPGSDYPSGEFLEWLKLLLGRRPEPLPDGPPAPLAEAVAPAFGTMLADLKAARFEGALPLLAGFPELLPIAARAFAENADPLLEWLEAPRDADLPDQARLVRLLVHEFLRQVAPAFMPEGTAAADLPALRSEVAETRRSAASETIDRTPVNLAFTHSGLQALKIDGDTLRSFPEPFREGMAARARRLGDVGPNAPEHWEGELGLPSVHGYFTGGSSFGTGAPVDERIWKELRSEIRAFNDPASEEHSKLRLWVNSLFRIAGIEILQIELGQDPYEVEGGKAKPLPHRKEHFGFRDGISQPYVDLGLGSSLPGMGTPARRGSWAPVAPGEIFLDAADETGRGHMLPVKDLRQGATFLVFRKLEQDVYGFRAFLDRQRPDAPEALAARFVGRWPDGTPLVRSPQMPRHHFGATESALNDFRYAADDPSGSRCPLGAHVRRANPRDTGGRNNVRHHRILRRGMSYGGPLLSDGQADDGEPRGILFVAANARIDVQFEVVQGDWLNGGEFLGQAGLGRCPIAGTHDGSSASTFLEAGAAAPVRGLPSFVTNRGGDYFFAPGLETLRRIAERDSFRVNPKSLPFEGCAMGDTVTPELFGEDRLKGYAWRIIFARTDRIVRLRAKRHSDADDAGAEKVAFVARHSDVTTVLSNEVNGDSVDFSVWPYRSAGQRITRGEHFLIGTDEAGIGEAGAAAEARRRLFPVLRLGWAKLATLLGGEEALDGRVRLTAKERLDSALRRISSSRRVDIVDDLAAPAAYGVLERIFGVRGPAWLTELAPALQFARQHVSDLPPDWIAALKGERPADPAQTTLQVWTAIVTADLIANVQVQQALQQLARQAGSEMLNHLDVELMKARAMGTRAEPSLLRAFVENERSEEIRALYDGLEGEALAHAYYKDVAIILLEIVGSTLAVVPLTFASVMHGLLTLRIDLALLMPRLRAGGAVRVIYEAERLFPNVGVRMRRCERSTKFGDRTIHQGDIVAAMIAAANKDPAAFPDWELFSLGEADPSWPHVPRREIDNYLLFGVKGSNKDCWGRNRVAMPILEECLYACGRLQGLRRVAGARGEPQKMAGVTIGLPARFTRIAAKAADSR